MEENNNFGGFCWLFDAEMSKKPSYAIKKK